MYVEVEAVFKTNWDFGFRGVEVAAGFLCDRFVGDDWVSFYIAADKCHEGDHNLDPGDGHDC